MFHSFNNCCQSFLFSHRHKLGLKRQMKKNARYLWQRNKNDCGQSIVVSINVAYSTPVTDKDNLLTI